MLLFDDDDKLLFAEWLTDESSDKWVYLGLIFFKILFQRLRQKFACAGQLIVTTLIWTVKLPSVAVTRLPF